MNYGPLIFLAAFFGLASSWFGFVLAPQLQLGGLQPTNAIGTSTAYPLARAGLARRGLDVYRANGCAYCHSQQVRQSATVCDAMISEVGTNAPAVIAALQRINPGMAEADARKLLDHLPVAVRSGVTVEQADSAVAVLKAAGAKAERWVVPVGPDIARGWGNRRTVADDYLYDYPVMLGSQRVGPDLANVGARLSDPKWHLLHLYAPQMMVEKSAMPPYRFLFETRRIEHAASPDALDLKGASAPPAGYEVVPTEAARALAGYLSSLRADAPLFETPLTVPPSPTTETNAPAASATAPK